jgi:Stress responsive A/B Barrel Domain
MLAHNVYFTLEDDSIEAQKRLVDDCHKYLKDHPGIVFFAAGTLARELARPVNDRDFHVGLHIIFTNQAAHDAYQVHESHQRFVAENKASWKRVRVFDSLVTG